MQRSLLYMYFDTFRSRMFLLHTKVAIDFRWSRGLGLDWTELIELIGLIGLPMPQYAGQTGSP